MPTSSRCPKPIARRLLRQYARFQSQMRTVRKAMADYFAGQRFFDFYTEMPDADEVDEQKPAPRHAKARSR